MTSRRVVLYRLQRHRESIRILLLRCDDRTLNELVRLGEHTTRADGYPARTIPEVLVTASDPEQVTAVEAAANRNLGERVNGDWCAPAEDDPTVDAIREFTAQFSEMAGLANKVSQALARAIHAHDHLRGRQNDIELCAECNKPIVDPPRPGNPATRRIDGQPYHAFASADREACYWVVRRRKIAT